ncbi:cytochrome c oxidase assembly protein [Galactobacter valiniphilus]|uniref:cytochrome c oxidase assembly protein n=1 Tax=Galactobacter valiniphilus TaxID=2676122 RepID=UPI0037355953
MANIAEKDRPRVALWLALPALPIALIVTVLGLWMAGSVAASALGDPGAFTRWGLPIARLIHDGAMTLTIGTLIFATAILPRSTKPHRAGPGETSTDGGEPQPAFLRTVNVAAGAAAVWTLAAAAVAVLSYSDAAGLPLGTDSAFTSGFGDFLVNIAMGRAWAAATILAALTTTLAFALRSPAGLACATVCAMSVIIPMALIGHASGGDDHWGAVNGIGLHLAGVAMWAGGIGALAVVAGLLGHRTPQVTGKSGNVMGADVLSRFSALATAALFLVVGSGVVSALIRVNHLDQLGSPYGILLLLKLFLSVILAFLGLAHRRSVIPRLRAGDLTARRAAWSVIGVEVAIMSAVMGLATVLGRTAPPVPEEQPAEMTPARRLTGYELPPELHLPEWITVWRFDWLWVAVIVFLAVAYTRWFVRVRRRGDSWSVWRLLSFYVGLIALFYITSGAPAVYGMVLFSMHMVDHMALTMVAPFFLVVGSPIALALKAMGSRNDGTRGPREWTLTLIHSKYAALVTNPIFAAVNFAGSIILFYNTDIFGLSLRYHVGHELMIVHFLLTGYIFAVNMIGLDPLPRRATYPMRLVMLLATMVFHAFYATSLMGTEVLIQPDWFGNLGRPWGDSAIADQKAGAGAMWGIGEVPTLLLALGVAIGWSKSDARETKRRDREADRSGEAELNEYNDMFARLAAADAEQKRRTGRN